MSVPVDYRCEHCAGVSEHRVPSPPPPVMSCPACGGPARRLYGTLGLLGRAGDPVVRPRSDPQTPPCLSNRSVPGLCHIDPALAPAWIARATGDKRALERELSRQETASAASEPLQIGGGHHHHHHSPGHSHSHDGGHVGDHPGT